MNLIPSCPRCGGSCTRKFDHRNRFRCNTCGLYIPENQVVLREKMKARGNSRYTYKSVRKQSGSGQIAERITIPQFRWGSSRLG